MPNRAYAVLFAAGVVLLAGVAVVLALTQHDGHTLVHESSALPVAYALEDIPLFVTRDPSASRWADAVAEAVQWWEGQVPGLVIDAGELERSFARGAIVSIAEKPIPLMFDGSLHEHDAYVCERRGDYCAITRQLIDLSDRTPEAPQLRVRIVAHSIGHALGLAHDPTLESVMFPNALIGGFVLPSETRDLIKGRYGK